VSTSIAQCALMPVLLALLVLVTGTGGAQTTRGRSAPAKPETPATRPERTAYRETSRYDDVVAFIREVDAKSPRIHVTTFGYSFEGRLLPLVVVGDVPDGSPAAVRKSGKTRVYLQGNIHAGEVEGKEALQMLLRELARGDHARWLQSLVLLIAPIYNADGNERVHMSERNLQNGPVGGVGQRPNAQDLDLNRDHMKLESPEARSLMWLLREYDPHVGVDLHTTNGSFHAYQLTYAPPLHPNTAPRIVGWLRTDWLPSITRAIKAKDGWDFYYYGNVQGEPGTPTRGWYTFDHRPRFNNNYLGLRNRIAILSEAYSYLPFDERIAVTRRFVIEILDYARQHAAEIRQVVEEADHASVVGQTLALRARTRRAPEPVDVLMGGVRRGTHPYTGAVTLQRTDERRVERMAEWGTFEPTDSDRAPAAYLVPPELTRVVELLETHGVRLARLLADVSIEVEEFRVESNRITERPFQGHRERTLAGTYSQSTKMVAAGTVVVRMDQPLARVIFTLLEPRSDDGVANWNVLDDVLEKMDKGGIYPIRRTFASELAAERSGG
jgi:Zinc carboxypeptidase